MRQSAAMKRGDLIQRDVYIFIVSEANEYQLDADDDSHLTVISLSGPMNNIQALVLILELIL